MQDRLLWCWAEGAAEFQVKMPIRAMVKAAAPVPIVVAKATFL
jgi:hypothetical protein